MMVLRSAVARARRRRFVRVMGIVALIGAGVGAAYGVAIAGPGARSLLRSLLVSVPIGVIDALLTGGWIAGIEIFVLVKFFRTAR